MFRIISLLLGVLVVIAHLLFAISGGFAADQFTVVNDTSTTCTQSAPTTTASSVTTMWVAGHTPRSGPTIAVDKFAFIEDRLTRDDPTLSALRTPTTTSAPPKTPRKVTTTAPTATVTVTEVATVYMLDENEPKSVVPEKEVHPDWASVLHNLFPEDQRTEHVQSIWDALLIAGANIMKQCLLESVYGDGVKWLEPTRRFQDTDVEPVRSVEVEDEGGGWVDQMNTRMAMNLVMRELRL